MTTYKTDSHNITEILLKVALSTTALTLTQDTHMYFLHIILFDFQNLRDPPPFLKEERRSLNISC